MARFIIDCEPDQFDRAVDLVKQEFARFDRYDKIGWGWGFGSPNLFVRRIKDGLSVVQSKPKVSRPTAEGE